MAEQGKRQVVFRRETSLLMRAGYCYASTGLPSSSVTATAGTLLYTKNKGWRFQSSNGEVGGLRRSSENEKRRMFFVCQAASIIMKARNKSRTVTFSQKCGGCLRCFLKNCCFTYVKYICGYFYRQTDVFLCGLTFHPHLKRNWSLCKNFQVKTFCSTFSLRAENVGFVVVLWWALLCVTPIGHFWPSQSTGFNVKTISHDFRSQRSTLAFSSISFSAHSRIIFCLSKNVCMSLSFVRVCVFVCARIRSIHINKIAWDRKSKAHNW